MSQFLSSLTHIHVKEREQKVGLGERPRGKGVIRSQPVQPSRQLLLGQDPGSACTEKLLELGWKFLATTKEISGSPEIHPYGPQQ